MSRKALVLLVCCCDFRDGAERLIPSKSLGNAVIRAFPGLFRILRMCAPRHAAAVVRPRERKKSADRRRRILISRLLIIRASVPRRKSPFPAYFKGFPAVSLLIPPYPAFLKYPVSPHLPLGRGQFNRQSRDKLTGKAAVLCLFVFFYSVPEYAPVFPFWWSILWQKHLTPDQSFLTGIIVPHSIVVIEDVGTAQICRSCNGRPPRSPADHLGF